MMHLKELKIMQWGKTITQAEVTSKYNEEVLHISTQ